MTLVPVVGEVALPLDTLLWLFTLVAVVLLITVLPAGELLLVTRLLLLPAGVETVEELLLTVLLTLDPPLSDEPPPDASLSEPV